MSVGLLLLLFKVWVAVCCAVSCMCFLCLRLRCFGLRCVGELVVVVFCLVF